MSPKISDEKKEQQRLKIVQGARVVFREKGYEQTTMKDIREKAGVSAGSLYMYFTNKEEIFINILEREISDQENKIVIFENESIWSQIEKYIENMKDYCSHIQNGIIPVAYEYSISAWREDRKEYLNSRYDMGIQYIKQLIDEGIKRREFHEKVEVLAISSFMVTLFEGISTLTISIGNEQARPDRSLDMLKEFLEYKLKIK